MMTQKKNNFHNILLKIISILFIVTVRCTAYDTFFPLSIVQIIVPKSIDGSTLIHQIPIVKFNVTSYNKSAKNFIYSLENSEKNILKINNGTGDLWIDHPFSEIENLTTSITSIISAENLFGLTVARMSITIIPTFVASMKDFCSKLTINLCFWDSVLYTVAEDSNNASRKIGEIGPEGYPKLCPDYKIGYKLLNGTNYVTIKDRALYTKASFDHDTNQPGQLINIQIQCHVKKKTNIPVSFNKIVHITVLDRNDNSPRVQGKPFITIHLNSPHFTQNQTVESENIIFLDDDSLAANSKMVYEILNDFLEILLPVCKGYEADHLGQKTSVINCKLVFSRDGNLNKTPYCVLLKAVDYTIPFNGTNSANVTICLTADLSKLHKTENPTALALQSTPAENLQVKNNRVRQNLKKIAFDSDELSKSEESSSIKIIEPIIYPNDVTVFKQSTNLTRVMQAGNITELMAKPNIKFKINNDPVNAFGITQIGGIVYVRNSEALKNAIEEIYYLTISWQKKSVSVMVRIIDNLNWTCAEDPTKITFCAHKHEKQECLKTCGLGAESEFCQWRPGLDSLSVKYATCSPNFTTCPDKICDPLEEMGHISHQHICPQDCTVQIFGTVFTNALTKKGIFSASGVCSCDEFGKCSCSPPEKEYSRNRTKSGKGKLSSATTTTTLGLLDEFSLPTKSNHYNVTAKKASIEQFQCGIPCLALGIGCPVVLLIIAIILLIARRRYDKNCKRKLETGERFSYGRDGNDTEVINVDIPLVSLASEMHLKCDKWEFPRENLSLDIKLGEGEFGKVVMGYATNINGDNQVTKVAVKMLKNGANSVELLALMSEFKLLQEVKNTKNVIQLLGVCSKGEFLLIMEYAEHGSLRNYLRLSRKLDCSGINFENSVEPVTVTDILSFAWQICKGMTYLAEIKLVHRDLAARNVLLGKGKICKISDFGLTRILVYEDDAYLKRSKDRVPVKWMAPESLADQVYTTRSDVWAFGVLTWELITLGASPYPGISPQNLYHLLKTGYRMEKPENCSEEIYSIVRTCWADDPYSRPSFKFLADQFEKLLGRNAKYLEIDHSGVSNPFYCADSSQKTHDDDDIENLDHLWYPCPYPHSRDSDDFKPMPNINSSIIPEFYDSPRPLIEQKTTEQNLKYENDIQIPNIVVNSSSYINNNIEKQNIYSLPKRGKSYIDMTGISDNLDTENIDKKLSKDITFRFSSLLNLNEHINENL